MVAISSPSFRYCGFRYCRLRFVFFIFGISVYFFIIVFLWWSNKRLIILPPSFIVALSAGTHPNPANNVENSSSILHSLNIGKVKSFQEISK